ncbi:MAG: sugar phosphate isomerase/epimerase [Geminicoccaceae bacterium]|nr:sugar phosphate isomerase/epimerase [Geminicoccaceae bacterium]
MTRSPGLGVITDGISRDLAHALAVMDEFGLEDAELQFVGDKEVGDLDAGERRAVAGLVERHGKRVSCISRHIFAGLPMATTRPGDAQHRAHMDALARCIAMAQELDCPRVRIMSGRKEMILWGAHGAEVWNVARGAWDALLALIAPAVELARREGITLVVETGNGTMVHSAWTARRLIDDLDARDTLRVLWDPANAAYAHERAWPDAYELLRDGYLGHLHVKDVHVDTPRAFLEVRPLGEGDLGEQWAQIGRALRRDGYAGSVSLESVHHPGNGDFEAGFRRNVERFEDWFGGG